MNSIKSLLEQRVLLALDDIRKTIRSDGGDLEFVKIEDSTVYIKLKGACIGCPFSLITLNFTIEQRLRDQIPEIKAVVAVD